MYIVMANKEKDMVKLICQQMFPQSLSISLALFEKSRQIYINFF